VPGFTRTDGGRSRFNLAVQAVVTLPKAGLQSWKKDPKLREMEADMMNLVPADGELNGDRSIYRFGMIPGEPRAYVACDLGHGISKIRGCVGGANSKN